jgi:Domain of unknown function (DUF4386)
MPAASAARRTARLTGIAYLGIVVCGLFAEFLVRMSLVVTDDAATTAGNVAESQGLFRAGIGADLLMIGLDVAVAVGLYKLLRPVNRSLALAAAALRLIQAAILAANLVNLSRASDLSQRAIETGSAGTAERALQALETHALVYDIALIAFGLSCVVLGRLLRSSRAVPRLLAVGMGATGLVYLFGSLAAVAAPGLSSLVDPLYLVAIVVEPAFALWLIVKGVDVAPPRAPSPAAPRPAGATG